MANQVSLYDNEDLYEEFNLFNPNEKKLVLLDSGITQTVAEELLMREKDPTKFLTSEVIEKFDKKCGELCQQTKIVTLQEIDVAIDKSDQYYEKEEETINSVIDYCDKGSEVMSEISNAIGEFRAEFRPEYLKRKLNHHIDVANNPCYPKKKSSCSKKGYLTQTQFETMKKSVKDATNLDEIEETSAEIKRSMNNKREKYEKRQNKNKVQRDKVKSKWKKAKKGIKSMASPANLQKAAAATSTIISAIGKIRDKDHTIMYQVEI